MAVIPLDEYPIIAAGTLNILLAGVLLYLGFNNRLNRAFALVLVFRGMAHLLGGINTTDDLRLNAFANALGGYLGPPIFAALLSFISIYPVDRRWPPRPLIAGLLLAALVALDAWYMLDHSIDSGEGALNQFFGGGGNYGSFTVLFMLIAALLARDAFAENSGSRRQSMLLVSLAFAMVVLANLATTLVRMGAEPFGAGGWTFLAALSRPIILALVAYTFYVMWRRGASADDPILASASRKYLLLAGLPLVTGIVVATMAPGPTRTALDSAFSGIWRLPLSILTTYALLKHQLFDVDVKIKWGIKRGTLAAIFLAVFFIVTQVAEQYLQTQYDWAFGGLAAGLLLFAIAPLQRAADRIANAAMPNVHEATEIKQGDRAKQMEAYKDAVRMALADGVVTKQEERALARLASVCQLTPEEAYELREAVEAESAALRTRPTATGGS